MSDLTKYLNQIADQFKGASRADVISVGTSTLEKVGNFLQNHSLIRQGSSEGIYVANEQLGFDTAMNAMGIEDLERLVTDCGISKEYLRPCMESILIVMDRCMGTNAQGAWHKHNRRADHSANNMPVSRSLNTLYTSDTVSSLEGIVPSAEAFGINTDLAVPDLKIAVTIGILNFHTRLVPRMLPTRNINQPTITYTKTHLEIFDMQDNNTPRLKVLDLYEDPTFARNELQKIVPNVANEDDPTQPVYLTTDNHLRFNKQIDLFKLSLDKDRYGHTRYNRTDLIAENVRLDKVYVSIAADGVDAEIFEITVPLSVSRLTRMVNAQDSAMRNANISFKALIGKNTTTAAGTANTLFAAFADEEKLVLDFNLKPTISLKFGTTDCLGAVAATLRHDTDNGQISPDTQTAAAAMTVTLYGYDLDARFSEENLRKTNIAIFSHRQPFSYDIPIGRNYVYDYAIGQENAEENAINLSKIIGIGQDDVALKLCIRTLEDVYDRIQAQGANPTDVLEYIGTNYVAGDKVIPTVFCGTLDFSSLNVIRDADRSGDIRQKAVNYLTAATSRVIQNSLIMQQLGGKGVTFRAVTSMEIIGNIFSMPHIHDHLNKDDRRGELGDGVEYTLVLPNGVTIEFITSTFKYMRNQVVMWPFIKGDAESELNFAHNFDYGTMVAHYTPTSGESAHHRLFANIRELPIVLNPVGLVIDINGMDIVNGIAINNTLRPTVEVEGNISITGEVTQTNSSDNGTP